MAWSMVMKCNVLYIANDMNWFYNFQISADEALQNMTDLTIASSGAQATSQFSQMAGEILNMQVAFLAWAFSVWNF